MPIESATFINSLNPGNPAGSDPVADTDNHLRLIKTVLKNTFPLVSGPVNLDHHGLNGGVPIGAIILWSGATTAVPSGWVLCAGGTFTRSDGGGTVAVPDLRDRFVVGAGLGYAVGTVGGVISPEGTADYQGTHSHAGTYMTAAGAHTHTMQSTADRVELDAGAGRQAATGQHRHAIDAVGDHVHGISVTYDGGHVHTVSIPDGRPPYYALAYIMRI